MEEHNYKISYQPEELIPIVAKLAEQYTGFESTSITYEKAQQLMNAVIYCIREYERGTGNALEAVGISSEEAYAQGYRMVREKVEKMKSLYHLLIKDFQSYGNTCLKETILKGIPEFLKWYDIRYDPQNTMLTLDYPVLRDLSFYTGIDRIYEYVKCIFLEQRFLGKFPAEYIKYILNFYSDDAEAMTDNLYSIVFLYMAGHILLKKPLSSPGFTEEEYGQLRIRYAGYSSEEIAQELRMLIKNLVYGLFDGDEELLDYMLLDAENMAIRIKNAADHGNQDKLFECGLFPGEQ